MLIRKFLAVFVLWLCTCSVSFSARPFFLEPDYIKTLPESSIFVEDMTLVYWNLEDDLIKQFAAYMPTMGPLIIKNFRYYNFNNDLPALLHRITLAAKQESVIGAYLPDDFSASAAIAIARKYERPIIFLVKCPSDEVLNSYEWAYFAGYNLKDAGRTQGELFVAYAKTHFIDFTGDGILSFILIKGPKEDPATKQITEGFMEVLSHSRLRYRFLNSYVTNGKYNGGYTAMDFAATKFDLKNVEGIICNNDLMALGALSSVMNFCYNGYGSHWVIPIVGVGGSDLISPKLSYGSILGSVKIDVMLFSHMFTALAHELVNRNKPTYVRFSRMEGKKVFIIFSKVASDANNYLIHPDFADNWLETGLKR